MCLFLIVFFRKKIKNQQKQKRRKKMKKIKLLAILVIMMGFIITTKAQTAYVSLDTLSTGDTITFCTSNYSEVTLYAPTAALTNLHWEGNHPTSWDLFTSSITLTNVNSGEVWFSSSQTGTMHLYFYLVATPTLPGLPDIDTCGNILNYTLNAGNVGIGAHYLWNTGATTQTLTVTQAGTYTVTVSNGCGFVSDASVISIDHSNDANLGPDQSVGLGTTVILTTGNTNITTYDWSTGATTDTIHVTQTGSYSVTTTSNAECLSTDTVNITVLYPPTQEIDLLTMDTTNGNIRVVWSNIYSEGEFIDIYREITTNNYQLVGTALYTAETWTDTVDSRNQPWRYKIAVVDTFGNEGTLSSWAQSIHVWVTANVGGGYTVQWTPLLFENKEAVQQYNIYAGNHLSQLSYLAFVSGNVTVYTLSGFVDSLYVIGAQLSVKGVQTDALSNWISQNDATGISENTLADKIKVYPTLTDGPITIETDLDIKDIIVCSVIGQYAMRIKDKYFILPNKGEYIIIIVTDQGTMRVKVLVQ